MVHTNTIAFYSDSQVRLLILIFSFSPFVKLKTPSLFQALAEAFIYPHTWFDTDKLMDLEQKEAAEEKIRAIISHMNGRSRDQFFTVLHKICIAYNLFLFQYVCFKH